MQIETAPLVEAVRGEMVESQHRGVIVVSDAEGNILHQLGDPGFVTTMRSSAKPFQALTAVESGAADRFHLSPRELAVICASHAAEPFHLEAVRDILSKLGLTEDALRCGGWGLPAPIHNNCSGKHAGMLAAASHEGWPLENYYQLEHPLQVWIREILADFTGGEAREIGVAVDGCGVPTWAVPVERLALAFARLADPTSLPSTHQDAVRRVQSAMQAHPEMVSGTARLVTDLMRRKAPALVCKSGAEGAFGLGIPPGHFPGLEGGVGIGLKIEDAGTRAMGPIVIDTLRQLGLLSPEDLEFLRPHWDVKLYNTHHHQVGFLRPCFHLVRRRGEA